MLYEDKRLNKYKKLIEVYELFNLELYNDAIRVLGTILETILYEYEQVDNSSWFYIYYQRIMEYRRQVRKNKQPMIKQFNQWFHIAMEKITKNKDYGAYSYLFDMKTILEKLNDTTRI